MSGNTTQKGERLTYKAVKIRFLFGMAPTRNHGRGSVSLSIGYDLHGSDPGFYDCKRTVCLECRAHIHETEINIIGSGASTEMWFGGKALQNLQINHYQETCVTVTWIKLTEQLFRLTGNPRYADAVETSYYNALLGSMSNHGATWAKYTPLNGQRLPGSEQCGMGLNCCEASGPRGLFLLPLHMVMESEEGISVNYFASGTFMLKSPSGNPVTVSERTAYPKSGNIDMEINPEKEQMMEVAIRIPAWSKETLLEVNGKAIVTQSGQYIRIKRAWKKGDHISLKLDMRARLIETGITLHSIAIVRKGRQRYVEAQLQSHDTPFKGEIAFLAKQRNAF